MMKAVIFWRLKSLVILYCTACRKLLGPGNPVSSAIFVVETVPLGDDLVGEQ
jgi:hypothetical protein